VSTPANPQHLLRRPKKPQPKHFDLRIVAVGAVIAVVAGGAIAGFAAFGHGKTAAAPPAPAPTGQAASLSLAQSYAPPIAVASVKHKAHKPAAPSASPSPNATDTPQPTPAPEATAASTHVSQSDSTAHAKHEAALKLAAARRAALTVATSSTVVPTQSSTIPAETSAPAPVPAATTAPQPVAATPDAEPTPVYAPTIVVDARFVERVTPVYPDIAREQNAQGTAIVLATIGPDGRVLSVAVDQSTGNRQLDNAAIAAARASRFAPPEIDGKPATETYRIVYSFDPNG
jgi:periplasmic protein TonB